MPSLSSILFRNISIKNVKSPAIINPVSSIIPKLNAAVKPITDHIHGMIRIASTDFWSLKSNKPNVNIVVGHGNPTLGDDAQEKILKPDRQSGHRR